MERKPQSFIMFTYWSLTTGQSRSQRVSGIFQLFAAILALRRLILSGRRPTISLLSSSSVSTAATASGWASQYFATYLENRSRKKADQQHGRWVHGNWRACSSFYSFELFSTKRLWIPHVHFPNISADGCSVHKLSGCVMKEPAYFPTCSFPATCWGCRGAQRAESRSACCKVEPLWTVPPEPAWAPPPPGALETFPLESTESLGTSGSIWRGKQVVWNHWERIYKQKDICCLRTCPHSLGRRRAEMVDFLNGVVI